MKKIDRICRLFFIGISFSSLQIYPTHFFLQHRLDHKNYGIIAFCPLNLQKNSSTSEQAWIDFHKTVFGVPRLLEYALEQNLPFLLVVPEKITDLSPLDPLSVWIESARVALAWTSAYFRFHALDVKIITVPNEFMAQYTKDSSAYSLISDFVDSLLLKKINDNNDLSPEDQIKQRFFVATLKNTAQESLFKVVPCRFTKENKKITREVITHALPNLEKNQKRVVVSGAAGFIGSHYIQELLKSGHQVIGLDSLICGSMQNLALSNSYKNFYFKKIDITSSFDIPGHIDYVVHLASVPSPEFYYRLPHETLTSGLDGTRCMLDLAVKKHARFLFSSTSEVYGDATISPQHELYPGNVDPLGKRSQYDESKRGAETLINLYYEKYGLDIRIARIFNTYGPHMSLDDGRVVTNFIKALLDNNSLKIYGNGLQTRSFGYVSDTVEGLLALTYSNDLASAETIQERVFNIGSDEEYTVTELASKINSLGQFLLDRTVPLNYITQIDQTDPKQRRPDLTKIKNRLGYCPKVTLAEGLDKTLQWFLFRNQ